MKSSTRANHPRRVSLDDNNRALVSPTYDSVKYGFSSLEDVEAVFNSQKKGFVYSRYSNPTVSELEMLVSDLQGCENTIALGSGVAAISHCLLALLSSGDQLVLFYECYQPTRTFAREILNRFGVKTKLVSIDDESALADVLSEPATRVILFESPTNPVLKIANIGKIVQLAKANDVLTILDNTFAGFHNHQQFDVDLYVHSLTKFAGGHGDVMGGSISGSIELIDKIRAVTVNIGAVLDARAASRILRGLKTYELRYSKQCSNAAQIAQWLSRHPDYVTKLRYPGLETHPQHNLARKQMADFGTLVCFDLARKATLTRFIARLKIFQLAPSLGSTESLCAPCELFYAKDLEASQKQLAGIGAQTLRLAVGIEAVEDLIADLKQALTKG